MLFRSVHHIVARFSNSTSTPIHRFFYSPSLLRRRSSFNASLISRCCSSVSDVDVARDSVVKIFSFSREPNVVQPWQTTEKEYSSSGFAISGRRILTNAHVVGDHLYLQVRKHGSPTKYKAEVKAFRYGCDLAILGIDSEEFWEDINPLELGGIPFIGETVYALGYPRGVKKRRRVVKGEEVDELGCRRRKQKMKQKDHWAMNLIKAHNANGFRYLS